MKPYNNNTCRRPYIKHFRVHSSRIQEKAVNLKRARTETYYVKRIATWKTSELTQNSKGTPSAYIISLGTAQEPA